MTRSTHSAHYVVEEKLAVRRDHHDLQFVREALGNDFVDQQRILFQDRGLARHAFGIGGGGQTNALCLGLRQKFATDRKSTRLNSSHQIISYAVFCLKKKMCTY